MRNFLDKYFRITTVPIFLAMLGLMSVGIYAIFISEKASAITQGHAAKQMIYAAMGVGAFFVAMVIPYQKIGRYAYVLFGITFFMLILVLLLPAKRGANRWIDLGFILIQPSEIAKLSFIILLAWYLRLGDNYRKIKGLIWPFLLTFIPMGLILVEPDLGTSLLLLPTLYIMLFMAGAKVSHLLSIVIVATVLILCPVMMKMPQANPSPEMRMRQRLSYFTFGNEKYFVCAAPLAKMRRHQLERVWGWLVQDPNDPEYSRISKNVGYQLQKSKMIIGAGKMFGRGDWNRMTTDAYFRVLPDDHTDFIFAVVAGQHGIFGAIVLFVLYGVIFLFGTEIAVSTYDPFGRLLAVGVLALLFSQIIINVGMTIGILPITGMTLPLISYGGSSLLVNCAALGLLANIDLRRPLLLSRRPFEYGKRKEASTPYVVFKDS